MILVDGSIGAKSKEISDATNMIKVPVGKECLRDSRSFGLEYRGKEARPRSFTFAGIDENSLPSCANEVGICSLPTLSS